MGMKARFLMLAMFLGCNGGDEVIPDATPTFDAQSHPDSALAADSETPDAGIDTGVGDGGLSDAAADAALADGT